MLPIQFIICVIFIGLIAFLEAISKKIPSFITWLFLITSMLFAYPQGIFMMIFAFCVSRFMQQFEQMRSETLYKSFIAVSIFLPNPIFILSLCFIYLGICMIEKLIKIKLEYPNELDMTNFLISVILMSII
jgi:uncharacterized membrane-anchored protein